MPDESHTNSIKLIYFDTPGSSFSKRIIKRFLMQSVLFLTHFLNSYGIHYHLPYTAYSAPVVLEFMSILFTPSNDFLLLGLDFITFICYNHYKESFRLIHFLNFCFIIFPLNSKIYLK